MSFNSAMNNNDRHLQPDLLLIKHLVPDIIQVIELQGVGRIAGLASVFLEVSTRLLLTTYFSGLNGSSTNNQLKDKETWKESVNKPPIYSTDAPTKVRSRVELT